LHFFCPNQKENRAVLLQWNITMTFHSTFTPLQNTPYISPSPKGVRRLKWTYIRHYLMYDYFVHACSSPPSSSSPYLCSPFNMHPRQLTAAIGEAHPQAKKRGYIYILSSRYLWYTPLFHFTPLSYMVVPLVCVLNRVLTNITHLRTKDAHDRSIFSSKSVFSRVWKYIFGYQFKGNIVFYDDFNFNANLFLRLGAIKMKPHHLVTASFLSQPTLS
jgi:hypothetical protein